MAIGNAIGIGFKSGSSVNWTAYWTTRTPTDMILNVYSDTRIDGTFTINGSGQDGHKTYKSTDNLNWTLLETHAGADNSFSATGLTAYTKYYFKTVAYKGSNESNPITGNATTVGEVAYGVLESYTDGTYNIFASLAQNPTDKDKVIMTFLQGVSPNYDATKVLMIRTSTDKGQSFGAASVAYDPGGVLCVQEQHSAYTSDGRLHILLTNIDNGTPAIPSLIYLYSDNNGVSFTVSDISALVNDATYVVYRNSGDMVENNGVLLSCFYSFNNPTNSYRRLCLRLVNGTWTKVTVETTAANETESSLTILSGDNLIMMTRDDVSLGFIQYSSADNGLTWTRLGTQTLGVSGQSASLPARLNGFDLYGERVIVFYFPHKIANFPLKAIYARAVDLLELGLGGWNYSSIKTVFTLDATHQEFHGGCLHYNNNYNAIGCWPIIKTDFSSADLRLFEVDTTDYDTLVGLLFPSYSADAESNAFNAVNNTNPTAIVNLVGGLKQYSLYTKVKAAYPILGGTEALHKFNLVNPADNDAAFRLHFAGTWTHSATGMTPNGVDAYADTHLNASSGLTLYSAALGYYSRTNVSEAGIDMGSYHDNGVTHTNPCLMLRVRYTDGKGRFYSYNGYTAADVALSAVVADSRGFSIGSRTANNVNKFFIRGLQSGATVTAVALNSTANFTIYIGANNADGVATSFVTKECAFAIITDGLTNTEIHNLNRIIHYFQKALNRNV